MALAQGIISGKGRGGERACNLPGDKAANPPSVNCISSPAQALHSPMTVAVMVLPVAGFVTVMGPSQGDSLIDEKGKGLFSAWTGEKRDRWVGAEVEVF